MVSKIPPIKGLLEQCGTLDKIPFWKSKNINLTDQNFSEHLFVLSTDVAKTLRIRHDNLKRNISKLRIDKDLRECFLTSEEALLKDPLPKGLQKVFALNPLQIKCLLLELAKSGIRKKKFQLLKIIESFPEAISQLNLYQEVIEEEKEDIAKLPLLTDVIEEYVCTNEGIRLWKRKGVVLTPKNVLNSIFVLSSDLADCFEIRHNNLIYQNITKLQNEKFLSDHLLKIKQMVSIGSSAQRAKIIYALTRRQTHRLINGILRSKKGKVVRLYAKETLSKKIKK